jgi:hypothetical protein
MTALHFGPRPDLFPRELQLQWAAWRLQADDDALLDSTAAFLCEDPQNVRRAMRKRAVDGAFAARGILTAAVIAIVREGTASQVAALILAGAGAVVGARLAVKALRADAFLALALVLRHSSPGPDGYDAVVGQFADAGGLELIDGTREEMD